MARASVTVKFEFPKLFDRLQAHQRDIEVNIASTIQTQIGMRFDQEGASNGHEKWAPLKMRQGQILSLSGTLRKSISPPAADGRPGGQGFVNQSGNVMDLLTEVGTKLIYASVHDRGAVIVPVKKQALRYMNPGSGKFVFSKRSVIPARPFTDRNQQDTDELNESIANQIAEILGEP
jgi:phage gpG-like protein